MPSERVYQNYFPERNDNFRSVPEKRSTLQSSYLPEATGAPRTPSSAVDTGPSFAYRPQNDSRAVPPPRPGILLSRHTSAELPQTERRQDGERPGTSESNQSFGSSAPAPEDLKALLRWKKITPCRRAEMTASSDDWYTILGAPVLDFCGDCVHEQFDKNNFYRQVVRSPRASRDQRKQCALGSSLWMRLAWLLTLERKRGDLVLLKEIAEIDKSTEACPGVVEESGPWFGLRDADGYYIQDFRVCYNDVRKIECLFNNLGGQFVRHPDRHSHTTYRCAMRCGTDRVWPYLTLLKTISDRASARRQAVDRTAMMPFVTFAEKKINTPECTRDTFITQSTWHYIPHLPEFTVCAECFESVVIPEVSNCRPIAMRFNQTKQPVPYERGGSSCQLYSARMRKYFRDAVYDNDFEYLAQKARRRQKKEADLQEEYREVQWKMGRLEDPDDRDYKAQEKLQRQVEGIIEEWKKYE